MFLLVIVWGMTAAISSERSESILTANSLQHFEGKKREGKKGIFIKEECLVVF